MVKFKTLKVEGFEPALYGMRLPLKSHIRADSYYEKGNFIIGPNDYDLAKRLWLAGTEHRKFIRQIQVWVSISAPRFFFQEWDTYRVGTSANSESTMHKLLSETFSEDSFDLPKFEEDEEYYEQEFQHYLSVLKKYKDSVNSKTGAAKELGHQNLKKMLPESFIQTRCVNLNYEVLATMYRQRKNHRLPLWKEDFVSWIHTLPYPEFIMGFDN